GFLRGGVVLRSTRVVFQLKPMFRFANAVENKMASAVGDRGPFAIENYSGARYGLHVIPKRTSALGTNKYRSRHASALLVGKDHRGAGESMQQRKRNYRCKLATTSKTPLYHGCIQLQLIAGADPLRIGSGQAVIGGSGRYKLIATLNKGQI